MARKDILPFIPFCKQHILDNIDGHEGQDYYGCDLGGYLTEAMNADGSFTYSREEAKEYIKEWWDDAADYSDYEEMNWGKRETNPFGEPELFTVRMVIEGVSGLMGQLPIIEENWTDKIELTPEVIETIKQQVNDLPDDTTVF